MKGDKSMTNYVAKQFKTREFLKIVKKNGYRYERSNGDHDIFFNGINHLTVPTGSSDINIMLARRLIKEYNLKWK